LFALADKPTSSFVRQVANTFWRHGRIAASAAILPPERCSPQANKFFRRQRYCGSATPAAVCGGGAALHAALLAAAA